MPLSATGVAWGVSLGVEVGVAVGGSEAVGEAVGGVVGAAVDVVGVGAEAGVTVGCGLAVAGGEPPHATTASATMTSLAVLTTFDSSWLRVGLPGNASRGWTRRCDAAGTKVERLRP
jgi:hypothetical protein